MDDQVPPSAGRPKRRTPDLSQEQYEKRLRAHGLVSVGVLGYWRKGTLSISELNAGPSRRARLAYLLNKFAAADREKAAAEARRQRKP